MLPFRSFLNHWIVKLTLTSLLTLAMGGAMAAVSQEDRQLSVQLLQHSGMDSLIAQYPDIVKSSLRQKVRHLGAPTAMATALEQRVDGAFNQDQILNRICSRIAEQLSTQEMQQVVHWFESPIGQKILAAELDEVTEDEYVHLQTQLDSLTNRYQGSDREQLFVSFDRATAATENMLNSTVAIELSMAATLYSVFKGEDVPDFAELRQLVENRRTVLRGRIGQQVYLNYLYTYRDLSLQDLQGYIAFAGSETGQRFVQVVNDSVYNVLAEQSEKLGMQQES